MDNNDDPVAFKMSDALRIDKMVSWFERYVFAGGRFKNSYATPQSIRSYAQISSGSSLTAGSLASPTSCNVDIWVPDPASVATPPPFVVSVDSDELGISVANRSAMTGAAGTMVKIEFIQGEWSIYWAEC